jgi:muramoyltetrapeptide carboxypeptidase
MKISIVAPSAVVPQVELGLGVERLEAAGFVPRVHAQVRKKHLFFAGSDEVRAKGFYEAANDPATEALWCARGGYGSFRLLPLLEKLKKPARRKLLVGYSDSTALMEFVRQRWGWATLHGPMPSFRAISTSRSAQDTKAPIAQIGTTCQIPPSFRGASPRP